MPEIKTHPSAQALSLFSQGKLSEAQATTVASHLETCADCRNAVARVPADSFLGKVRAAKPGGTVISAGPAPARPAAAPLANVPPELANHPKFRIIRELGRGGMGVIYLAEHRVLEKQVALKVISPAVLDNPDVLARFHAEARAAAKLDHQNIARAYDADQAGNLHFLVMEFVEGVTLAQLLEQKGPLPIASACRCVRQAALGLHHAFEQGMVHRDIKPQNLMLTPKGMVKVLDFGLARLRNERKAAPRLTQLESFMGTPEYVAPEQATDAREADTRADIYSLGCTLYALLAGRPPFVEDTVVKMVLAHIEKEPLPLHEVRPDVPAELSVVVGKMLAKDPAQRYQRPIEVAQALVPFVKGDGKPGLAGVASLPPGVASAKTGTRIGGDTSRVKGPGRGESKRLDKAPAAAEKEASPFCDLLDRPATALAPKKAKKERKEAKPTPAAWWKRPAVLSGGGAAILALLLVVLWGAGVFKVKTADGTIVLEGLPPDAEVLVDGGTVTVTSADGKTFEVRVDPGKKHRLAVKKNGFKVFGEEVELDAGGRKSVLVRLVPERKPDLPPRPDKEGTIVLENLPPGAVQVLVDGDTVTLTSSDANTFEVRVAAGKKHRIEVNKDGFKTFGEEIEVQDGGRKSVLVQLEPERKPDAPPRPDKDGTIVLENLPPGAVQVLVDGAMVTVTSSDANTFEVRVAAGKKHRIEVNKDGFKTFGEEVEVQDGGRRSVLVQLEPEGEPPSPSKPNHGDGFVPLFNGKDLKGWSVDGGDSSQWSTEGDTIVGRSSHWSKRNYLLADKEYANYTLRFEFKVESGHHGVAIRAIPGEEMPFGDKFLFDHPIIKLMNAAVSPKESLGTAHWVNSAEAYVVPPTEAPSLSADKWSRMQLTVRGDNCTASIDGKQIVNLTLDRKAAKNGAFIPALARSKGKVGFQTNTGTIHFRKVEIKELHTARPDVDGKKAEVVIIATTSGLKYVDEKVGDGKEAKAGDTVVVLYTGWLKGGKKFDSSLDRKKPAEFSLNNVIKGWQEGIPGMKVGGKRKLVIPPDLAYAKKGAGGGVIPPDAELTFEIELLDVNGISKPQPAQPSGIAEKEKDFVPLFNGKDLKGWKTHPKQPGGWTVEDGCLVGRSATAHHLFSERDDYENFHLRAEVQINKYGNSGIYFRSNFGLDNGGRFPMAYEAQIAHSYPKPNVALTGSLYGFSNVVKPLYKPDEWFTMDVIAEGNHIIIKVNEEVTTDFVDKGNTYRKGHLALQAISDTVANVTTVVRFRKIEIKKLPAK